MKKKIRSVFFLVCYPLMINFACSKRSSFPFTFKKQFVAITSSLHNSFAPNLLHFLHFAPIKVRQTILSLSVFPMITIKIEALLCNLRMSSGRHEWKNRPWIRILPFHIDLPRGPISRDYIKTATHKIIGHRIIGTGKTSVCGL